VLVRDLTLAGTGGGSGLRLVELATPGAVRVEGAVTLAGAAVDDRFQIDAARIDIPTSTGSIRLRSADGAPSGVLQLNAGDILVAGAELLAKFDSLSPSERLAALRTGTGQGQPRGSVEGGTVRFRVGNSLAVENSGSVNLPGGLTTGAGGLVIERSGSTPINAVLFGSRLAGGQVTGGEAFFRATFGDGAPAGTFTAGSELNLINLASGRRESGPIEAPPSAAITATSPPPSDFDQLALEQDGGGEEGGGSGGFGSARQFLVDLRALTGEELIDDPVAGSSDSTIWGDEEDDEEECDPDEAGASGASCQPAQGGE
jgi:hypothetical protein